MDEYDDPKKRKFKLQIREEVKELNQFIKQRISNEKEGSKSTVVIPDEEIDKYVNLEDRDKLREKFRCLAMDNCQLREKQTCLRYELENTQDMLEETRESLFALKHREKASRDELAYLKHLSTNQAEEIKSLQEHVKRLQEFLHQNGLEYQPERTEDSQPPVTTESESLQNPKRTSLLIGKGINDSSWLQSLQTAFRKVKIDFLQSSENAE